ncbi:uncharacterized protein HD556DRAFT_1428517 [Suillus plorans]|uniref:Uncharacterized protein n=1 Tax=Suillus plorans TaxID=116603 RepID=A0A9P7DYF7_9AGAM|nr:uncharacterized protein HD556DRAFT_1428517 [Suillus plorans]KAG1806368.1 hypothetical protein HD556DRAFT_1428517 [Suillus plorans]
MSGDENNPSPGNSTRKRSASALHTGPRKKAQVNSSNPLVLHGRHFGWTVFALCNFPALLTAGILRLEELQDTLIEDYPADVRCEHRVFVELIDSYSGLLARLTDGEEEDIIHVGELLGKGASGTLKSAVLEWLMPREQPLIPPLSQNIKLDCGFNHEVTSRLLCPTGLDWSDGFKHVFTSPSSVNKEPKAMRSGNAYLHGMKSVTKGSLAYVATQIWFALSSSSVFSRTDTVTDSENFYHSILDLLEDPDEIKEVTDLMMWWTRHILPNSSSPQRSISKNSALAKIREKCAAFRHARQKILSLIV